MTGFLNRALLAALALWAFAGRAGDHWVGAGERVQAWTNGVPADRVRLGVRDRGVYRVTAAELAAASGRSTNAVREALAGGGLSLRCGGRPVAWCEGDGALLFYGEPTRELYAPENVYWLSFAEGARMAAYEAGPEPAATNAWFMHAEAYRAAFLAPYDYKDRRSSNTALTNVLIFGEWIAGSSTESLRAQERTVSLPGFFAGAATGCVARLSVASYYDFSATDTHTCEVWVNGVLCGAQGWSGEQALTVECAVPAGVVTNGTAALKVRSGQTVSSGDFLLLEAELVYPRRYDAAGGLLLCAGGPEGTLAAGGFASPQIRAWDVTEPEAPLELSGEVTQETNGLWRAALLCGDAGSRYAVFEEPAGCYGPSVGGVRDTDWHAPDEMPELAIVIPPRRWVSGFDEAVAPLAELRRAQGRRTRVIDAEELYNAFSDGLVHPGAFQRFCAAGATAGAPLKYLLFAGHGGGDYKLDVFGFGEKGRYPSLFPLYFCNQVMNDALAGIQNATLYPNDPVLGDVEGGPVPEVAVGRFLATNAAELVSMVEKTVRYERTETWKKKGVFVACKQLYAWDVNFSNFVAQTAAGFAQGGWSPKGLYPKPPPNDALNVLWEYNGAGAAPELRSGAGLLYYYGHSNDAFLGTGGSTVNTFVTPAVLRAGTWPFAPVALLVGCRVGRWTFLDLKDFRQCVAEAGVRNPSSGFAAAVSPAGYMESAEASGYSNGFRDAVARGVLRLGDAYLAGFAALSSVSVQNLRHMTLLGDPSLTLSACVTARGTPVEWMVAEGLTNNPYADLEDPDSDGFPTWMEQQAGTDHARSGVSVRALGAPAPSAGGATLTFETVAGAGYRVLSTTNLAAGAWESLPWKASSGDGWSEAAIPADWPVETVTVPFDAGEPQRFYKVRSAE
jgi:hypothetical protein